MNRWESTYWVNGTVWDNNPNYNIDLSALWGKNHPGWEFEQNLTYTVQFVIENTSCINPVQWNESSYTFKIEPCVDGEISDRSAIQNEESLPISIVPNPASSLLMVRNVDLNQGDSKLIIRDMVGKTVLESSVTTQPVYLSEIPNGVYVASIFQNGKRIFSNKMIIQH